MRHHVCRWTLLSSSICCPQSVCQPRSWFFHGSQSPLACYSCRLWHLRIQPDVCSLNIMRSKCLSNDERSYCCHNSFYGPGIPWKKAVCSPLDLTLHYCFGSSYCWTCQHYGIQSAIILEQHISRRNSTLATCIVLHWGPICVWREDIRQCRSWSSLGRWTRRFMGMLHLCSSSSYFLINRLWRIIMS